MEIKAGQKYRHYKGGKYLIVAVGLNSENLEEMVVYKSLYDKENFSKGTIWIRPKKMWLEELNWEGKKVKRFEMIEK